jgi:signal peptidase I
MPQSSPNPASNPDAFRQSGESIRETLESIVVAFILAFVFRAFVVEAFVIPTGSMAATLYGEHGTVTCSDCGYTYAYGLPQAPSQLKPTIRCSNCGWTQDLPPYLQLPAGNPQYGDRILVLKWPFDIGGESLGPKRWEVTVFKDPKDNVTNFIKRLIGMPEEVLEIIDGDVYTVPLAELDDGTIDKLKRIRHLDHVRQYPAEDASPNWLQQAEQERAELYSQIADLLYGKYRIHRKTDMAQSVLWMDVYNHDFQPNRLPGSQYDHPVPEWKPTVEGSNWDSADRNLSFHGADSPRQLVAFHSMYDGGTIGDVYAYNHQYVDDHELRNVSDLKIVYNVFVESGDGYVESMLTKRRQAFYARLAADGKLTLRRNHPETGELLGEAKVDSLSSARGVELAMWIVDFRVGVAVGRKLLIETTDKQYAPNLSEIIENIIGPVPQVAISAEMLNVTLKHVRLYRDVYYRDVAINEPAYKGRENHYRNRAGWGTFGNPIMLQTGEYFMCGDNSPQSLDSRLWWYVGPNLLSRGEGYKIGTVPADQMIGRAFFVYWPSGLQLAEKIKIGLIPNVGDMRWIR